MNRGIVIGGLGLAILGTAVLASGVFASVGNSGKGGQNYSSERHSQMAGSGHGKGMMNGQRGQNRGGNFIDKNGDGTCDHLQ